jgi:hypothetical protein
MDAVETVTDKASLPLLALMESAGSAALMFAVSALYKVITPLLPPETVATPLVKLIVVDEPKAIAVPVLFFTVGAVTGLAELLAPEKVRFLAPAKPVTVLPPTSSA